MWIIEDRKPFLGPAVRDDRATGFLERLTAGDIIEMMMAVDQILDRLISDLSDFGDIILSTCRTAVAYGVGRDYAVIGHHEYRLVIAVAEDIDVISSLDLGRFDLRSCWRGGLSGS